MVAGMAGVMPLGLEYLVVKQYAIDHGAEAQDEIDEWVELLGTMDGVYLEVTMRK